MIANPVGTLGWEEGSQVFGELASLHQDVRRANPPDHLRMITTGNRV